MTNKKQKLELTWVGKGEEPELEPRILIEDPDESYGDPNNENMLIYGDNLLALKALEQDFTGKIKCIYIDPPYNTGNAFEHYDDGLEHSQWLNLMKPRLEILRRLLSNDGSLWISIDDDESHYLKMLCDEVFGRSNFVANVIWEKKYSPQNDAKWLSDSHDHILVFAKNKDIWRPNLLPRTEEANARYKNLDNDIRGPWKSVDLTAKDPFAYGLYEIAGPTGKKFMPGNNRHWVYAKDKVLELIKDNRIWFGVDGNNKPSIKRFLSEVKDGAVSKTIWYRTEVGDNQEAKREIKDLFNDDVFTTPKPERLLERILTLSSNEGDLVLDSFLGSGTTAAVSHKMKRRWIGIELGEHCMTHCVPRLQKVINGEDQGGISKSADWQGGGGFKFYNLAPSLLKKDRFDNWVINPEYNPDMLAAAMAKHEGFKYNPSQEIYWKQGQSTEKDYIFTTTQFITMPLLDSIYEEMAEDESLLICCKAFSKACASKYPNITIRKIPKVVLGKCEFDNDDYSLNISSEPTEEPDDMEIEVTLEDDLEPKNTKKKKKESSKAPKRQTRKSLKDVDQLTIFH